VQGLEAETKAADPCSPKETVQHADGPALRNPKGNGYQATLPFPDGVSISSDETYPTIAEALTAAAIKLLDMAERLATLDGTGA